MTSQIEQLNSLSTDQEKLDFLKNNSNFIIRLDNDAAKISINEDLPLTREEIDELENLISLEACSFKNDFGNREGVLLLFKNLNIKARYI